MKLTLNIFRISLLSILVFRMFFLKHFSYEMNIITYVLLAISLVGMIVLEVYLSYKNDKERKMRKTKIAQSITSGLFIICLILNLILKGRIGYAASEILSYFFWFSFGLLAGVYLISNAIKFDLKKKDTN